MVQILTPELSQSQCNGPYCIPTMAQQGGGFKIEYKICKLKALTCFSPNGIWFYLPLNYQF